MAITVHPSAIIDKGAKIGDGSRIWHFVHVCSGAVVGKNVSMGQGVFVGNKVTIGNNCVTVTRTAGCGSHDYGVTR